MFRVEKNVSEVYVQKSRDFQLISRLYDLAFQEVRQSCDTIKNVTSTKLCNADLLPLLSTKLGFFEDLQIPDDVYRKVLSAFPHIIRYKGSIQAINLIVNLFEKLVNTVADAEIDTNEAVISFYKYSPSAELLSRLLNYVKPAGYVITLVTYIDLYPNVTQYKETDTVKIQKPTGRNYYTTSEVSIVQQEDTSVGDEGKNLISKVGFVQSLGDTLTTGGQ